ncbi:MAG: DUF2271 domain-containing protein [Melioribacteraceae bacterium]|nr:DUF2271 domain-containing protein [Melioribacteraceae bacterium]
MLIRQQNILIFFLVSITVLIISCDRVKDDLGKGYIELTYKLNEPNHEVDPSYQTTIWIEDSEGKYIKSLLVSEYISYGGYSDSLMCLTWNNVADWENEDVENVDAVTMATPDVEENILRIDCVKEKLPPGNYYVFVETHLEEEYNILLRGEVSSEGDDANGSFLISYPGGKMEGAENVLVGVTIKYIDSEIPKS